MERPVSALPDALAELAKPAASPLEAAWSAAAAAQIRAARRAGRGRFLPGEAEDRWVDTIDAAELTSVLDRVIGEAVRGGADLAALRPQIATVQARIAAWRTPPPAGGALRLVRVFTADRDLAGADLCGELPAPTVEVILGDNRDALRALAAAGRTLDAAIEDPPYDTGNRDLPYRDRWPEGGWTCLMTEHFALLRAALTRPGIVAVHIDDDHHLALAAVMRAAFGNRGDLGAQVWDKRNPKGDAVGLAVRHELIRWAVRSRRALRAAGGLHRAKPEVPELLAYAAALVRTRGLEAARQAWFKYLRERTDLPGGTRMYRRLDDTGRPWRPVSMAWPNRTPPPPEFFTPLIHPVTGQSCPVPPRGWRNSPETMARLVASGEVAFGADHTTQPVRRYLLQAVARERLASVLTWPGSDDALLADLGLTFPHAKPLVLLDTLLDAALPAGEGVVFDGFAGSGSLGHAVLDRNHRLGAKLRAVLCEADRRVAAEVLLPRLQRALLSDSWSAGAPVGAPRAGAVWVWEVRDPSRRGGDDFPAGDVSRIAAG
jgi:hypothetical protein